jgi:hypothetical protein
MPANPNCGCTCGNCQNSAATCQMKVQLKNFDYTNSSGHIDDHAINGTYILKGVQSFPGVCVWSATHHVDVYTNQTPQTGSISLSISSTDISVVFNNADGGSNDFTFSLPISSKPDCTNLNVSIADGVMGGTLAGCPGKPIPGPHDSGMTQGNAGAEAMITSIPGT